MLLMIVRSALSTLALLLVLVQERRRACWSCYFSSSFALLSLSIIYFFRFMTVYVFLARVSLFLFFFLPSFLVMRFRSILLITDERVTLTRFFSFFFFFFFFLYLTYLLVVRIASFFFFFFSDQNEPTQTTDNRKRQRKMLVSLN